MRYIRPDFYDSFACIADRCPDTCCAGWQIMIDEESLERYEQVKGSIGELLEDNIDWEEGCFYQSAQKRCAFLNEKNLCDLYLALGEEGFCDTCRNYPRHTEEFEGLREYSLSLSCPVAAKMILSRQGMLQFLIKEDDEEDELGDEFEDFDLMLFTQLEDARNAMFEMLSREEMNLREVMDECLRLAAAMQDCVEEGRYFEIEELIEHFKSGTHIAGRNEAMQADVPLYYRKYTCWKLMEGLERLRDEWSYVLAGMEQTLYAGKEEAYGQCCDAFSAYLEKDPVAGKLYDNTSLQLFVFFVYTYFCGAVYDGWVYSKMALAVRSVEFLQELFMARWKQKGTLAFEDYVELSYRYAREIEHSDFNLNTLEEIWSMELGYCPEIEDIEEILTARQHR